MLAIGARLRVAGVVVRGLISVAASTRAASAHLPASFAADWNFVVSVRKPYTVMSSNKGAATSAHATCHKLRAQAACICRKRQVESALVKCASMAVEQCY